MRRAVPANTAYRVAFRVASSTIVMDNIHNCGTTAWVVQRNCGRKATKKMMPLVLSAVTSQVLANNFHREPAAHFPVHRAQQNS